MTELSQARTRRYLVVTTGLGLFAYLVVLPFGWSFMTFNSRSMAGPAKLNLKSLCAAQQGALKTFGSPALHYRDLGVAIDPMNRFAYFVAPGARLEQPLANGKEAVVDPLAVGVQANTYVFTSGVPGQFRQGARPDQLPESYAGGLVLGQNGTCPDCSALVVAAGNVDADDDLDIWSASTSERVTPDGDHLSACQVFHERDDTRCTDCWFPTYGH